MVCSLSKPFGLSFSPQKPSNRSTLPRTLSTLRMTLFTLRRLFFFYHYNLFIFTSIVFYYNYYVKNHPPKEFQAHIFPFDWVLGVVFFQLPLGFHPIFSYYKPMDWYDTKGYISFGVSRIYVSIFSSIWCGSTKLLVQQVGYRIWALMGVRENDLELILKF